MQRTYLMVQDMNILDDVTNRVGIAAVCAITVLTTVFVVISLV